MFAVQTAATSNAGQPGQRRGGGRDGRRGEGRGGGRGGARGGALLRKAEILAAGR